MSNKAEGLSFYALPTPIFCFFKLVGLRKNRVTTFVGVCARRRFFCVTLKSVSFRHTFRQMKLASS